MSRLGAEDDALWARVTATVRALGGRRVAAAVDTSRDPPIEMRPAPRRPADPPATASRVARPVPAPDTLDGGWDRRLRRGVLAPDATIDLHGHTLATAHAALDQALERAIGVEARLLLVVTGRPPRPGEASPRRGLIRAAIGDWLAASRHTGRIAAVRGAHPRHGGAGALYVVLRRRR